MVLWAAQAHARSSLALINGGDIFINDELLLAWIRSAVEEGRYYFTDHALTKHPIAEGFTASHALEAIGHGAIIERRDEDGRCLICGEATGILLSSDFVANYLHCSIQWDFVDGVVIITMYRPKSSEWINQFRRRRSWPGEGRQR